MSFSTTFPTEDLALPKGTQILVTGASGFVASHVIKEALDLGYRVRGTVRSREKADLVEGVFNHPFFSTVVVEDLAVKDAWADAIKGCEGIIHTSSIMSFDADPNKVIPDAVDGVVNLLKAAKDQGTCKRFVYTSSSTAATMPRPDIKFKINKDTWNNEHLAEVWARQPPYKPEDGYSVYGASKTEAEKAVWKFVDQEKPDFVVNCILPDLILGKVILQPPASTASWPISILNGNINPTGIAPQYMVNASDVGKLHTVALVDQTISNERILAFAETFDVNDVLGAVKRARPSAENLPHPLPPHGKDLSEVDTALPLSLLKKWYGQDGFRTLDDSIEENLEGFPVAEKADGDNQQPAS